MGNAWFSHQFLIACEKAGKPIKWEKPENWFPRKSYKTVSYVQKLGNWCSYFSHGIGALFSLDSHALVYFICYIRGFPHQFRIAWENAANP